MLTRVHLKRVVASRPDQPVVAVQKEHRYVQAASQASITLDPRQKRDSSGPGEDSQDILNVDQRRKLFVHAAKPDEFRVRMRSAA